MFTQTSHAYLRSVARAFSTPFTWVEYKALFSYYLNKREINKWRRREKEKEKRNKIEEFVIRTTFLDFVRRVDVGGQGGHQGSSNSVIRSPQGTNLFRIPRGLEKHIINRQLNFFHTTAGVRPSHMLFIISEKIMRESLHDHHTSISIGGRTICNVRFADDIDLITGTNSEPPGLTNTLTHSSNTSGLDINNHQS